MIKTVRHRMLLSLSTSSSGISDSGRVSFLFVLSQPSFPCSGMSIAPSPYSSLALVRCFHDDQPLFNLFVCLFVDIDTCLVAACQAAEHVYIDG